MAMRVESRKVRFAPNFGRSAIELGYPKADLRPSAWSTSSAIQHLARFNYLMSVGWAEKGIFGAWGEVPLTVALSPLLVAERA